MSNEIKVGDWTLTRHGIDRLEDLSVRSRIARKVAERTCRECCEIIGIDPNTDSLARDIAEEIVLHGTPVDEAIAKLQKHLESQHSANFSQPPPLPQQQGNIDGVDTQAWQAENLHGRRMQPARRDSRRLQVLLRSRSHPGP